MHHDVEHIVPDAILCLSGVACETRLWGELARARQRRDVDNKEMEDEMHCGSKITYIIRFPQSQGEGVDVDVDVDIETRLGRDETMKRCISLMYCIMPKLETQGIATLTLHHRLQLALANSMYRVP